MPNSKNISPSKMQMPRNTSHGRFTSYYPDADLDPSVCAIKLAGVINPTEYAFISPTETGLRKSIMDAIAGVREYLSSVGFHRYEEQSQGPANKVLLKACFVYPNTVKNTTVSLYRPKTKKGDPRIWFSGLGRYASAGNLLLLTCFEQTVYVLNLSNNAIWDSISDKGLAYQILSKSQTQANSVRDELIGLLKKIKAMGWIQSTSVGDPGVGETLEHELGIKRNNSTSPDYKGIELKTTRLTKNGEKRARTRDTLFTKTPDSGLDYNEILFQYGKDQAPRGSSSTRRQLYDTFSATRVNAYNLFLACDDKNENVTMLFSASRTLMGADSKYVSSWKYQVLRAAFAKKHPETMWIGAESKIVDGIEYFRYTCAQYTSKPNTAALIDLIGKGIITLDLAAHVEPDGTPRNHGMLWKIKPKNRALIVGMIEDIKL